MWKLFRPFLAWLVLVNSLIVLGYHVFVLPGIQQWQDTSVSVELEQALEQARQATKEHRGESWYVIQQKLEPNPHLWPQVISSHELALMPDLDGAALSHGIVSPEEMVAYLSVGPTQVLEILYIDDGPWDMYMDLFVLLLLLFVGNGALIYAGLNGIQEKLQGLMDAIGLNHSSTKTGRDGFDSCQQRLKEMQEQHQAILAQRQAGLDDQRDLLHGVAHEFRAPLARLRFAVDMLPGVEKEPEVAASVDKSISELDGLMAEILRFSKLQHGQAELKLSQFRLGELMAELVDSLTPHYAHVQFHFDPDSRVMLHTDRDLLARALLNILRNGARFAHSRVDIHWQAGESAMLTVADDGDGIPPGKRQRIFEPFTRLDSSRSKDSGGVGLGLAIVKSILNKLAIPVDVTQSQYGGACFRLHLPQHLFDQKAP